MWKSKFRRRAPSTRCCPRNYICPISTPSTRCCPQNSVCSMARVEVHAGLAAIEYPNSLVDFHAATDARDGPRLSLLGHLAFKVRAARKAGRAPGRPRGQPIRAPGAERIQARRSSPPHGFFFALWCSHVACYAVRSARFPHDRMAPRSEPLGSRPAPPSWLKKRHWHQNCESTRGGTPSCQNRSSLASTKGLP